MKFSCLKKYKLFRKKTVNFRIIIIFFHRGSSNGNPQPMFQSRNDVVLKRISIHILEQKQEKKKKKKKKGFIALQSLFFLCEIVFVTGVFIMKADYLDVLS